MRRGEGFKTVFTKYLLCAKYATRPWQGQKLILSQYLKSHNLVGDKHIQCKNCIVCINYIWSIHRTCSGSSEVREIITKKKKTVMDKWIRSFKKWSYDLSSKPEHCSKAKGDANVKMLWNIYLLTNTSALYRWVYKIVQFRNKFQK